MRFSGTDIFERMRDTYANRSEPESARTMAKLYWRSLLVSIFFTLVVSLAYGEWVLYEVLHDIGVAPQTTLPPSPVDRASLNAVLSDLEARQDTYDALRSRPPATPLDPSR